MTALPAYLDRYIALRRALGYQPDKDRSLLRDFVGYLEASGQPAVTVEAALAWASQAVRDQTSARRLSTVRGFARYLVGFEPDTQIPPPGLITAAEDRRTPHIFSPEEITALMSAASKLTPRVWSATMATVIGLMTATGLRPGEVYRLGRSHVDFDNGELSVMHSKHGKSRRIPLHATTVAALRRYARHRDSAFAEPAGGGFFLTGDGTDLTSEAVARTFRRLIKAASIETPYGRRPARLGDLRHGFAVSNKGGVPTDKVVRPTRIEGLELLPASLDLALLDLELVTMTRREDRVSRALEPVVEAYDYMVIDLPPSLSLVVLASLVAADHIIAPVSATRLAMRGLGAFLGWTEQFRAEGVVSAQLLGVLITMFDARTRVSREVLESLQEAELPVFTSVIPRRVAAEEQVNDRLVVGDPGTQDPIGDAYARFVEEVLERTGAVRAGE